MSAAGLIRGAGTAPCEPWPRYALSVEAWQTMAATPLPSLLGLWADPGHVYGLFQEDAAFLLASVPVIDGGYAALSPARPSAAWFERMIHDLWGHAAQGGTDGRPWLDHGRWGMTAPLSPHPGSVEDPPPPPEFLPVDAEDYHQIAVGPVHAGIIEPGHFRFSAQGELLVRLEIRLGYLHKGTLGLMRGKSPRIAARFAARLSGDSTVGHGIAFAHAAEAASHTEAPPLAVALRAVMAELERIANHLGDCGALANDAAFAVLPARFGWHREAMLQAAAMAFGHRLMMDAVIPGGIAADIAPGGADGIVRALAALEAELPALLRVYEDYSSLVDRMVTTGIVAPALAAQFAAGGYVGRASGREFDTRKTPGYAPYDTLDFSVPLLLAGDVDARFRIRVAEIGESTLILRTLLAALPGGPVSVTLPMTSGEGLGWAEGFRGDIWHWLRLDGGQIAQVFMRDPSWLQWPLLESAVRGNIVADFPLCNKSFNCSYSGVDL